MISSQTAANWRIHEYLGIEGLKNIKSDWLRLTQEMDSTGFNHQYETHLAYYTHLAPAEKSYRFLALTNNSKIRAICPVTVTSNSVFFKETLTFALGNPRTDSVFLDIICPDDDARPVLIPQVLRYLTELKHGVHWLVFDHVFKGSVLWECLLSSTNVPFCIDPCGAVDVINCDRSFEALTLETTPTHRKKLRRARNRAESLGALTYRAAAWQPELDQAFDTFLDLEAAGKKGAQGHRGALRFKPDQLAFYKEIVTEFGKLGRCEIHTLALNNQVIAAGIRIQSGVELASLKICYNEDHAKLSPGLLLAANATERCCAAPNISRFNLMSNYPHHKVWRPDVIPAYNVVLPLRPHLGPILVWLLRLRWLYAPKLKALLKTRGRKSLAQSD